MKRNLLQIFALCLCLSFCSDFFVLKTEAAFEFPHEYWKPAAAYTTAKEKNDQTGIIKYGKELLDIIKNTPDCAEKRDVLASKYRDVAVAYSILNDPENAYLHYKKLYDLVQQYPIELEEWLELSKAGVDSYANEMELYVDGGMELYYGAKNERSNGVLFGLNADSPLRENGSVPNESVILTYQELGQTMLEYNVGVLNDAEESGCAVEYALNCPNEGMDIKNIKKYESFLKKVSDLLKKYPDVPIFLRFAAEFNIWEIKTNPSEFKTAFRYVSNYFKSRNANVAIVWSSNQVSERGVDVHAFYPGDEYVDWVGLSSYAVKYYLGEKTQPITSEIINKTGENSNPVLVIREFVEKYGDRKPIMLAESGSSHHLLKNGSEDTTDFALKRMREYYTYIPLVYPQVKLIAHFDQHVPSSINDFRLSNNPELRKEYLKLTKNERFIQDKFYNNSAVSYRKVVDGTKVDSIFEVSCFVYRHGDEFEKVVYHIDDNYVGMSAEMPFSAYIDASEYSGQHTLRAVAIGKSGKKLEKEFTIRIDNTNRDVKVEIANKQINFDRKPIIYNSRTLVPMRKIFEELGAKVSWDAETRTAIGVRNSRTIKITVGNRKMYVNDKEIVLDTPPIILDARTLVPVRAVAEGLGCNVEWNDLTSTVEITQKEFKWSDWSSKLPSSVSKENYYIEKKEEYRFRTREKEYFSLDIKLNNSQYVRTNTTYGEWSEWQDTQIVDMSDKGTVETRTVSTPKKYFYAHYCLGYNKDSSKSYKTASYKWSDECSYHVLGWRDTPLSVAEDNEDSFINYVNGEKAKCANGCFRWYLLDTSGGTKTQYRSRKVYEEHIYWQWSEWSSWSEWDEEIPGKYLRPEDARTVDVEERTLYRYKEK